MNFKRYNESDNSWTDSHYIKKTDTDIITTLPATIYPLAQTATLGLKGNTLQNGTPARDNPIIPQGTGERTGNLINLGSWSNRYTTDTRAYFSARFRIIGGTYKQLDIKSAGNYKLALDNLTNETVEFLHNGSARNILVFSYTANFAEPTNLTVSFTASGYDPTTINGINLSDIMLNTGSTALPYEPYGIKIPISMGGTTNNVYLGEVQTERQIYKMRLTNPSAPTETSYGYRLNFSISSHPAVPYQSGGGICNITTWNPDYNKVGFVVTNQSVFITQNIAEWATKEGATQWLEENEVYVWYVLATPQTAVVNEPLMKIGDYADTLSNVSIPVIAGGDTISVDTTVQPSEVTISYKGWHPVQNVHERDNGAWT